MDIPVELFLGFIGTSIALAIFGFIRNPQIPAMLVFSGMFMLVVVVSTDNIQLGYSDAVLVNQTNTNFNNTANYAIVFNDINQQYLQASVNTVYDITTQDFWVAGIFERNSDTGVDEYIERKRGGLGGYFVRINGANDRFECNINDGVNGANALPANTISLNVKYGYACSADRSGSITAYLYNFETDTLTSASNSDVLVGTLTNTDTFTVARNSAGNVAFFSGEMDYLIPPQIGQTLSQNRFLELLDNELFITTNRYDFNLNTNDDIGSNNLIAFNNPTFVLVDSASDGTTEIPIFNSPEPNLFPFTELLKVLFALISTIFMLAGGLMVIKTQ